MPDVRVFDDFLPDPESYRRAALDREFRTYEFEGGERGEIETYHGIATPTPNAVPARLAAMFPGVTPTLSFFRKSPRDQEEPQFIHTDIGMGDWTALLYLNPDPPAGDGTVFWTHLATGAHESAIAHERSEEGLTAEGWEPWRVVYAKFNRLVVFPATFFHSRRMRENWGAGEDARLTQVTFGKGAI